MRLLKKLKIFLKLKWDELIGTVDWKGVRFGMLGTLIGLCLLALAIWFVPEKVINYIILGMAAIFIMAFLILGVILFVRTIRTVWIPFIKDNWQKAEEILVKGNAGK